MKHPTVTGYIGIQSYHMDLKNDYDYQRFHYTFMTEALPAAIARSLLVSKETHDTRL